jgi:hypothetical protein
MLDEEVDEKDYEPKCDPANNGESLSAELSWGTHRRDCLSACQLDRRHLGGSISGTAERDFQRDLLRADNGHP